MVRDFTYKSEKIPNEPGSKVMPKRIHKVGKHGEDVLEIVGYTDIYEERQASKDSVDINRLVARFLAGDTSVLDKQPGLYMDLTIMPENIHEMKNMTVRAEQYFKSLPKEEREKYEDVEDFLIKTKIEVPKVTVEEQKGVEETANE